jgi:hypothetical protein
MTSTAHSESVAVSYSSSQDEAAQPVLATELPRSTKISNKLIIALSLYAALRILFFTLAFPLFNNIDEKLHFLTILMYAQGHLPGKELQQSGDEFARTFLPYWSPEFYSTREEMDRFGTNVPLSRLSPQARDAALKGGYYAWKLGEFRHRLNFEAQAAPVYYVVAAGWYHLGARLGIPEWSLAYWVRLLNPIAYGLLVWLSYKIVRRIYPERPFLCLAVPALIAVFPQDIFFGMNRDVISPPMWAAALLLMLDAVAGKKTPHRSLLLASFLVGLTFLVEISNCVLYGALAATLWIWLRRSRAKRNEKVWVVTVSVLAAGLLPSLWMLRNYLVLGDLTGSKAKMRNFGWTVKPLADMFHNPLFSWHGLSYFLVNLTRTFWRGEYEWHRVPMRSASADWFYVLSSVLMVLIFVSDYVRRRGALPDVQRWACFQSLFLVASSILFMAAISLPFDYHDFFYPSRVHPYFVSGRIISGALLPFVLMYASGLELVTNRFRKYVPPVAVLACLMLFITISEIRVRSAVFSSPYNFFALSGWRR